MNDRAASEHGMKDSGSQMEERVKSVGRDLRKLASSLHKVHDHIDQLSISRLCSAEVTAYAEKALESLPGMSDASVTGAYGSFSTRLISIFDSLKADERDGFLPALNDWGMRVERAYFLARDLGNRAYLRARQKDRERIAEEIARHPLTRSWDDLDEAGAVERTTNSRRKKYYNKLLRNQEIILQQVHVTSLPSRLTIEPTSMCNFRCVMCPQGVHALRPGYVEMSNRQIEDLLPVLVTLENLAVQVIGEPTTSLQLGKITNFATANAVEVDMITNGSLLHQTNADLARFGSITISFDGATKETFEAQRAGSNFVRVVKNVRNVRKSARMVRMEFNVCLTRLNLHELCDIVRLAGEIGIDHVRVSPLEVIRSTTLEARELPHLQDMALTSSEHGEVTRVIDEARKIAEQVGVQLLVTVHEEALVEGKPSCATRNEIIRELGHIEAKAKTANAAQMAEELLEVDLSLPEDIARLLHDEAGAAATRVKGNGGEEDSRQLPCAIHYQSTNQALAREIHKKREQGEKFMIPYCGAPWVGGLIFSTGDYIPCCYLADAEIGSTSRQSFSELWNNEKITSLRQKMIDQQELHPVCENCNGLQRYQPIPELLEQAARFGYTWDNIEFPRNFNPPPAFKQRFEKLRSELFEQSNPDYEIGEIVEFSAPGSQKHLRYGFTVPTPAGRWTDGYECDLEFWLTNWDRAQKLVFSLNAQPFIDAKVHPMQRAEVNVNGEALTEWKFTKAGAETMRAEIPAYYVNKSSYLRISLSLLDALAPKDLAKSRSKAARALLIKRVWIDQNRVV